MPSPTTAGGSAVRRLKRPYGRNTSYTPSIKAALNVNAQQKQEDESKKEDVAVVELYDQPDEFHVFTEEQLQAKWKEFADSMVEQPTLVATLSHFPELKENCHLLFPIENSVQEDAIRHVKPRLLGYLRRELHNSTIDLSTYRTELAVTRRAYTDTDKLNAMAEKNPQLMELKKRFNLDFDSGDH